MFLSLSLAPRSLCPAFFPIDALPRISSSSPSLARLQEEETFILVGHPRPTPAPLPASRAHPSLELATQAAHLSPAACRPTKQSYH